MKKILAFVGIAFFVLPGLALGAVSYSRLPSGPEITSPITFSVSVDNFSEMGLPEGTNFWTVYSNPDFTTVSDCFASTTLSGTVVATAPVGLSYDHIWFGGLEPPGNVCSPDGVGSAGTLLEGDGTYTIFTIISASSNPVITFPTSTASSLVANVSSLISDPGLLTLLVLVVAVPFGFYVIKKLISIVPKR